MVINVGPGPGAYMLPSTIGYSHHDTSKRRMPQYSFGTRPSTPAIKGKEHGPGPAAYQTEKLTRFGKAHY